MYMYTVGYNSVHVLMHALPTIIKLMIIIINTHGRFAIAFLPLTTRLSTELFEAV